MVSSFSSLFRVSRPLLHIVNWTSQGFGYTSTSAASSIKGDPFRISESTLYQTVTCSTLSDFLDLLREWMHQDRAFTTSSFSDLFQLVIVRIVLKRAKSAGYMVRKSWGSSSPPNWNTRPSPVSYSPQNFSLVLLSRSTGITFATVLHHSLIVSCRETIPVFRFRSHQVKILQDSHCSWDLMSASCRDPSIYGKYSICFRGSTHQSTIADLHYK